MLVTIDDIAVDNKYKREYVRDKIVKDSKFPLPVKKLSQKRVWWDRDDVDRYFNNLSKKRLIKDAQSKRSAKPPMSGA